jgi:hypothetical protein
MIKTREQIIRDMCYTWRHDYGLDKTTNDPLSSGMTIQQRQQLWQQMAQVYDHCIAPVMQPRVNDQHALESNSPDRWQKYNWTTWTEP